MKKNIDIWLMLSSLAGGGTERVFSNLFNNFTKSSTSRTFKLILLRTVDKERYSIDREDLVERFPNRKLFFNFPAIVYKVIKDKPKVIFSANIIPIIVSFLLAKLFSIKLICRPSNVVSLEIDNLPTFIKILYIFALRRSDVVVAQSKYIYDDLMKNFNLKSDNIALIYNPSPQPMVHSKIFPTESEQITLLAVGRLEEQKGYPFMIKMLSLLPDKYRLWICGEGKLFKELKVLAENTGTESRITFLGYKEDIYSWMSQADIFLSTSHYEGFPNAIVEAILSGLPVVAFNCDGGTSEVVIDGVNGYLVPFGDIEDMSNMVKEIGPNTFPDIQNSLPHLNIDLIKGKYYEILKYDRAIKNSYI